MFKLGKLWKEWRKERLFVKDEERHPSETLVERMVRTILNSDEANSVLDQYRITVQERKCTLLLAHMAVTEQADHDEVSRLITIKPNRQPDAHTVDISIRCRVFSRRTNRWLVDWMEVSRGGKTEVYRFLPVPGKLGEYTNTKEMAQGVVSEAMRLARAETAASTEPPAQPTARVATEGERAPATAIPATS